MAATLTLLSLLEPLVESPKLALVSTPVPELAAEDSQNHEVTAYSQDLLAQARAEADEILADAHAQAEAFREGAWQEGFHDGQEAARQVVEAEMRAEMQQYRDALRAELQAIVDEIGQGRQALWERQEAEMVAFVLSIARQVIKTEVTQNPEVVTQILQNALRRVSDREHVRIRVAVGDAARVKGMRDELLNLLDGVKNLEIVDDRRIGEGGCVIETNAGTIDAKIETQLAEIARVLEIEEYPGA